MQFLNKKKCMELLNTMPADEAVLMAFELGEIQGLKRAEAVVYERACDLALIAESDNRVQGSVDQMFEASEEIKTMIINAQWGVDRKLP